MLPVFMPMSADRWSMPNEDNNITLTVKGTALPHSDHVEMSGEKISAVLYWNIDKQSEFGLNRALVFPMLRTIPNDTHASLMLNNNLDIASMILINGKEAVFTADSIKLGGVMEVYGTYDKNHDGTCRLTLRREIFPSMKQQAMSEDYTLYNSGQNTVSVNIPAIQQRYTTDAAKGTDGSYVMLSESKGDGTYTLAKGDSINFSLSIQAYRLNGEQAAAISVKDELSGRKDFISTIDSSLILDTPDDIIDTEFRYAKIRGSESIYKTKGGYMHSPGGESYYAALWANDQAEYINPFFPFLGYDIGNKSAINCFRHYARFMNDEYRPLPSSIIAEGDDIWAGAGDRGDAAMIAYGAARYALARGNKAEAEELWPLIEWCLEYCRRHTNRDGVVESDHDELEGRFPAGDANLCTASLYYDALISAAYLGKELKKSGKQISSYRHQADSLRKSIERYFGADIQGYKTYRYYDGNDVLRSWICIPLVTGIDERADQTVKALFSPEMYTADGVLTCQGFPVFWDRATLYALRGALSAGYTDEAISRLSDFSRRRLLGDHVPYPVEAWPEGSQRHLSAESGLYCRVITEGLFGLRPTGFKSFDIRPQLPAEWNYATLRNIKAFDSDFDIHIKRLSNDRLSVTIENHNGKTRHFTVKNAKKTNVTLK